MPIVNKTMLEDLQDLHLSCRNTRDAGRPMWLTSAHGSNMGQNTVQDTAGLSATYVQSQAYAPV